MREWKRPRLRRLIASSYGPKCTRHEVFAQPQSRAPETSLRAQAKPPVVDGWRLRDFYAGRAVLESRSGELYEVGPGSNLPGLGKVETIKRGDGRVVVVTPKGIITAAVEQRRAPYYLPYRY